MTVLTLHWRCWLRRNHHSNFITPMPQILGNKNRLCLTLHDELYIVDLSETLYFMADDHYTHVYYISDLHFMLPIGLARIEEGLEFLGVRHPHPFKRLGRKYIINALRILNINTTKQILTLQTATDKTKVLQMPKNILRELLITITDEFNHELEE